MATELITRVWCDVHMSEKDERVDGTTFDYDGRQVDLCEDCAGPFLTVAAIVQEHGRAAAGRQGRKSRKPSRDTPGESGVVCPRCGDTFLHRGSLASHARAQHGTGLAELEGAETPYVCEDCGRAFSRASSLSIHRRTHATADA